MRTSLLCGSLIILVCGALATDARSQDSRGGANSRTPHGRLGKRIAERVADKLTGRHADRRAERHRVVEELGITTSQKELIKQARSQHGDALRVARESRQGARKALHETARAPQVDDAALNARATELAAAERRLAEQRAAVRAEAQRILTPQQSAGLQALRAERKAAHSDKRAELKLLREQRTGKR